MESVELIASGYEWNCPKCENFNRETGVPEKVTCKECKTVCAVDDYHHAIGR